MRRIYACNICLLQYLIYIYVYVCHGHHMNESKHVVAALRKIIGLKQKEFGDLIGKSLPTVQAIEYGKLRLTEAVAEEISRQTGAHEISSATASVNRSL